MHLLATLLRRCLPAATTVSEWRAALYYRFARVLPWVASPLARRWWRGLGRFLLVGGVLLYMAFCVAVLLLRYWLLPLVPEQRGRIEELVSGAVGLPVLIGQIEADWQGLNPRLSLRQVQIADQSGRPALALDRVDSVLSWWSAVALEPRFDRLEIFAPTLHIRREADGKLWVAGLPINPDEGDGQAVDWLLRQNVIRIRDASLVWEDQQRGAPPLQLDKLNFVLDNGFGGRHRFGLTALPPPALASRLDIRGDLRGDFRPHPAARWQDWPGQLYAEFDYTDLAGWQPWVDYPLALRQGRGALRLWLGFADHRLSEATADVSLRDVRLQLAKDLPELELHRLDGRLRGKLERDGGFSVSGRKLGLALVNGRTVPPADFTVTHHADGRGSAQLERLDLATVAGLAEHFPLPETVRKALLATAPQGVLSELRAGWRQDGDTLGEWAVKGGFAGLGLQAWEQIPGVDSLSGEIDANQRGGHLTLRQNTGDTPAVLLPAIFEQARLGFDKLTGKVDWKLGKQLEVELNDLQFANADAYGSLAGTYRKGLEAGSGPGEIDLSARIERADGRAVWRYLPKVIGADTRDWLRTSLLAGTARDARLVLKGDLAKFPFRNGGGQFLITAKAENAALDYASKWPRIEGINADLRFAGVVMQIDAREARTLGARLGPVHVEIPDLEVHEEMLHIKGQASGPTQEFLDFIEKSPVGDAIEHFTDNMRAGGEGKLDLSLVIPLRDVEKTTVLGDFRLHNNQVSIDAMLPPLTQASAHIQFTDHDLKIPALAGNFLGAPVKVVSTTTGNDLNLSVQGVANMREFRKHLEKQGDWPGLEQINGTAAWRANVRVRNKAADVTVESSLVGVTSTLPEPLNKTASEALPLRVDLGQPNRPATAAARRDTAPREQWLVALGKIGNLQVIRRRDAAGWNIERGALAIGEPLALPDKGFNINVTQKKLDADFWLALSSGKSDGKTPPAGKDAKRKDSPAVSLGQINLKVGSLDLLGRRLHEVALRAVPTGTAWDAVITSREAEGQIRWDGTGRGTVRARLRHLTVPEAVPDKPGSADSDDLRELPTLDVVADNFAIGQRKFGQLTLQAHNASRLWLLDRISLTNPDGKFNGKGQWRMAAGNQPHETRLEFDLDAGNTGKLLDRLGFPGTVKGGTAALAGKLQWRGTPTNIDYPSLSGDMKLEARNGQFAKLEPGIGKLLSLLSLQNLPRRITLDFRDVFSDGFAYDSINGTTTVQNGLMRTDNLTIDGPAAKVNMSGEVDLGQETQRLKVRVQPAIGNSVALGAAVLAHPVTGVAAMLAQKLLRNPIDQVFSFEYLVSGNWDDPKVEKVGQSAGPAAAPSSSTPGNTGTAVGDAATMQPPAAETANPATPASPTTSVVPSPSSGGKK